MTVLDFLLENWDAFVSFCEERGDDPHELADNLEEK